MPDRRLCPKQRLKFCGYESRHWTDGGAEAHSEKGGRCFGAEFGLQVWCACLCVCAAGARVSGAQRCGSGLLGVPLCGFVRARLARWTRGADPCSQQRERGRSWRQRDHFFLVAWHGWPWWCACRTIHACCVWPAFVFVFPSSLRGCGVHASVATADDVRFEIVALKPFIVLALYRTPTVVRRAPCLAAPVSEDYNMPSPPGACHCRTKIAPLSPFPA